MLFHSQVFLLAFLSALLAGFYLLAVHRSARSWWLLAGSLFFYSYWDPRLLPLFLVSLLTNWSIAQLYRRRRWDGWIAIGVAFDLLLLGVFKYADFFASIAAALAGEQHDPWNIVLPLGISFFTFQQISYLVDLRQRSTPLYGIRDFALFVAVFPHLISGPIVRHHEIVPQFALDPRRPGLDERIGRGLTMLAIGLVKKLFIADPLSRIADPLYQTAIRGDALSLADGWTAAIAFTFQVYFDFSGYTDMAIGLALLFGFTLPINFTSPYQATSIREFWRHWHMTLTRFMRDYFYVPVGLRLRRVPWLGRAASEGIATLATMVLIGLWHGPAWTFVAFGLAHGLALLVSQAWEKRGLSLPNGLGWFLTFGFVAVSTVLFRSPDLASAGRVFVAMLGATEAPTQAHDWTDWGVIAVAAFISFVPPNSQTLALQRLRPVAWAATATVAALALAVIESGSGHEVPFVYFQF